MIYGLLGLFERPEIPSTLRVPGPSLQRSAVSTEEGLLQGSLASPPGRLGTHQVEGFCCA